MKEIAPGIWHWKAEHPKIKVKVSSYFLPEAGVLLDPLAPDDVPDRLEELGPPSEILLTNRHHYRDCQKLHERFGCAIRAPRTGMHEFDDLLPAHGAPVIGGARNGLRRFAEPCPAKRRRAGRGPRSPYPRLSLRL